jgi:hypothetical protein
MTYNTNVVCSETRTKHTKQSEHHVDSLNVNLVVRKETLGFKRFNQ